MRHLGKTSAALDLSSKSRDNYLRLLVLVLTAGQYVDTSFDYAAKILETTRQLASGLGAVTSAAAPVDAADGRTIRSAQAQGKDSNLYQVGHARAGLWIGQRFSELYRRAGESSKAAKQNALNDVFVRAIAATNARATSEAYSSLSVFRDFDAMFPKVEPPVEPPVQLSKEQGKKQKQQKTKKEKRKHTRATTASTLELFSPLETRGVWSRDTDGEEGWGTEPPSSQATSTSSTQGYRHFSQSSTQSSFSAASSTGTRHSTRSSRGPRKILVESDDEDHPAGHRGEEDDEWEEEEED
ncbi:SubName: Full=Uncharacterized protein {ECO:0000313/EMBL:CCA73937.1} [Serendipita indica DSM 11827]|nr:SubName: Full=Uncharacterized protein {ECO:0000313/EMBL:CCA73937.1} [Serendipita indica DSM 11827]